MVWLWSSVFFALLHSINFLLGQDLGPTITQLIATFVIGSAFYISRRATGLIVVPMVLLLPVGLLVASPRETGTSSVASRSGSVSSS